MPQKDRLTWMKVVNNVLLKMVSTGQLPFIAFLGLLVVMVYKTPEQNIVEVWRILQHMLDRQSGLGYSLAGLAVTGWGIHTRVQRRKHDRELTRMSNERNEAQQKYFKKKLESSK